MCPHPPILPSDAPALAKAIESADADTIRRRFLGGQPSVTPELLDRLTTVDYTRRPGSGKGPGRNLGPVTGAWPATTLVQRDRRLDRQSAAGVSQLACGTGTGVITRLPTSTPTMRAGVPPCRQMEMWSAPESLESRALQFVREWAALRHDEILANWERARRNEPLLGIDPLA